MFYLKPSLSGQREMPKVFKAPTAKVSHWLRQAEVLFHLVTDQQERLEVARSFPTAGGPLASPAALGHIGLKTAQDPQTDQRAVMKGRAPRDMDRLQEMALLFQKPLPEPWVEHTIGWSFPHHPPGLESPPER